MDGAILTHPEVLTGSGHVEGLSDPMTDCRTCKAHLRFDQLIDKKGVKQCPNCGGKDLTESRQFNLMFETHVGAAADESSIAYLRPETAQSIFVQFKNILEVSRKKLPFGIAQIGKAFRNEINPRNFTFRSREFEQMELEYFCRPEQGMELLEYWKEERVKFYENISLLTIRAKWMVARLCGFIRGCLQSIVRSFHCSVTRCCWCAMQSRFSIFSGLTCLFSTTRAVRSGVVIAGRMKSEHHFALL